MGCRHLHTSFSPRSAYPVQRFTVFRPSQDLVGANLLGSNPRQSPFSIRPQAAASRIRWSLDETFGWLCYFGSCGLDGQLDRAIGRRRGGLLLEKMFKARPYRCVEDEEWRRRTSFKAYLYRRRPSRVYNSTTSTRSSGGLAFGTNSEASNCTTTRDLGYFCSTRNGIELRLDGSVFDYA